MLIGFYCQQCKSYKGSYLTWCFWQCDSCHDVWPLDFTILNDWDDRNRNNRKNGHQELMLLDHRLQQWTIEHMSHIVIYMDSEKLVYPLINNQHLPECFKVTRTVPRLLHGFDMLWFRDWWAEPIRRSESLDETVVINHRVLVWEWESYWADTAFFKDNMILVELCECIVDSVKHLVV